MFRWKAFKRQVDTEHLQALFQSLRPIKMGVGVRGRHRVHGLKLRAGKIPRRPGQRRGSEYRGLDNWNRVLA